MSHLTASQLWESKNFNPPISLESLLKLTDVLNRLSDFEAVLQPFENLDAIEKLFSPKTRS